ncbi:MAG TPA: carboxymuconolactone decarboxylase family protein [Gemmatimonadaceae bacterium]|jgi:4-carboxymuconolactone decarboxylase|nr:carboxymuconolactone decarboxylase family protein [Gemmatimonadaceae bacterium]
MLDTEMTGDVPGRDTLPSVSTLDAETVALIRLSGVIAAGTEPQVRDALVRAATECRPEWVEEVVLQSYLFAGFPRALNAAREWRRISGRRAPATDEGEDFGKAARWRAEGEETCATVYGPFYERLRHNIRELHPALDAWMIVEGYGKVLSRPALDLKRRELCIVSACATARQDRQLHSHLHGAIHAGASPAEVASALDAVVDLLGGDVSRQYRQLLTRVVNR